MPPKKKIGFKKKKAVAVKKVTDLTLPPVTTTATTSLLYAVASSDVVGMGRLVSHYNFASTLSAVDRNNSNPLHMAAKRGDAAMLRKLLEFKEHMPISAVNACEVAAIGGYAAIHYACAGNHQQVLAILINHGADVNVKTQSSLGESPLHICCKAGPSTLACAKTLVDARANVNAVDSFGHNCSYWANQKGHRDMILELGLPEARAAGGDEFIAMMMSRPDFSMKKPKEKKAIGKKKK